MPKKVTAWACSFGCGRNVLTKQDRMARHESLCARNPERKACPTCGLNDYETPEYGAGIIGGYFCHGDHLRDGERMRYDCPHWEGGE